MVGVRPMLLLPFALDSSAWSFALEVTIFMLLSIFPSVVFPLNESNVLRQEMSHF